MKILILMLPYRPSRYTQPLFWASRFTWGEIPMTSHNALGSLVVAVDQQTHNESKALVIFAIISSGDISDVVDEYSLAWQ